MELYNKYRPTTFDGIIGNDLAIKSVKSELEKGTHVFLFTGSGGTGKAQPLYSKILTPNGFISMGDVKIGDVVFTGKGNLAKISGIYPQGKRDIYEITLQDRTKIRVSDEHLNVVYRYNKHKKCREDFVLTTKELIDLFETSRFKLRIDIPSVEFKNEDLPVDPYLLGALIGDGSLHENFAFSNSEEDVVEKVDSILRKDWNLCLKKLPGDNVDYSIVFVNKDKYEFVYKNEKYNSRLSLRKKLNEDGYPLFDSETVVNIARGTSSMLKTYPELKDKIEVIVHEFSSKDFEKLSYLKNVLDDMNLLVKSVDKHIPKEYLLSSKKCRIELLKGLFDTDGYSSIKGTEFATCSKQLSDDFAFLVRSLGIRDTISVSDSVYTDKDGNKIYTGSKCYTHFLKIDNSFDYCSSEKHLNRKLKRQNPPMRNIVSIEYVGNEECQCIMLDHEDHTYISDGFIPTHNTTMGRCIANYLGADELSVNEINSSENRGIDTVREIMEQMRFAPVNGGKLVYILDEIHSMTSIGQNSMLKMLEECPEHCYFILATTNPEKLIQPLKTRCSIINMKPLEEPKMFMLLRKVAHNEGVVISQDILHKVADLSEGSSRKGLKILSSILYLENDEERSKFLEQNDFSDEKTEVVELCRALLNQEGWQKYMECLEKLKDELSSNAESVRQAIMGYAYAVLKRGIKPSAVGMIQVFSNVDCYKNGKNGIMVGILDFQDYMAG